MLAAWVFPPGIHDVGTDGRWDCEGNDRVDGRPGNREIIRNRVPHDSGRADIKIKRDQIPWWTVRVPVREDPDDG